MKQVHQTELGGEPDARGRFGPFGGRFVPETVMAALEVVLYRTFKRRGWL